MKSVQRRNFEAAIPTTEAELVGVDGVGGLAHEVGGAVVLGEGNNLADGFAFSDEHDHAVQAEGRREGPSWGGVL